MEYDAFIGQVQHRIGASSRGEAEAAARALLQTLGQRLPSDLVDKIADQLPHELARDLRTLEPYEKMMPDAFFDRVSLREGVARPIADEHASAVLAVLEQALTGSGSMDKIRESLPQEFDPWVAGAGKHPDQGFTDRAESGRPGGGAGRIDVAGGSGVYPMSGPLPPGDAEVRAPGAWGQGERGIAGYADHGDSELHIEGLLGGEDEDVTPVSTTQTSGSS